MSDRIDLLSAAFELAPDGLLVFDDDGRWIEANREGMRLLEGAGRTLDELIGGLAVLMHEGAAAGTFETAPPGAARRRVHFSATARIADGAHLLAMREETPALVGMDSRLLETVNRELRTPLGGVIGVSRLLEETTLDARQREYVHALRLSAEALTGVIEGVLDYSEVEPGTLASPGEPFDPRTTVDEVFAIAALGAADVELFAFAAPGLPGIVRGDERRVRQVLMDVVGSAVKFTPHGEVVVELSLRERENGSDVVRFDVLGTGVGIDADSREAILEAFAQADGPLAQRSDATGLDLGAARRLVTRMGGAMGVESIPGEGSAFWFELPLRTDSTDPPATAALGLDGLRMLVVHARPARARLLVRTLEAGGAEVSTAADRNGALDALHGALEAGQPYDLALVSSAELAQTISADPALVVLRTVTLAQAGDPPGAEAATVLTGPVGLRRLHDELVRSLASSEDGRPEGGRVLVAEDSPVNQLVAVRLLEQRGFQVDVAHNGREALALFAENAYDAIFMDCEMPEVDGYEATREIRRREGEERRTPIIAMTASTLPEERERCTAAGMDYHTGKPVRPAGLDYIIAQAVRSVRVA